MELLQNSGVLYFGEAEEDDECSIQHHEGRRVVLEAYQENVHEAIATEEDNRQEVYTS